MNPGATTRPLASRISLLGDAGERSGASAGSTRAMRSPSIRMLSLASVPLLGSMTRPFLMSSMGGSFGIVGFRSRRQHDEEDSHAHGQAIGYLIENARLRPVRDSRINFQTADHGSGVKHERIGARDFEAFGGKLIKQDVFIERKSGFMQPLLLHPKNNDDVGP